MYFVSLLLLLAASIGARLFYIDSYPFGFSGHAIAHSTIRHKLYDLLFVSPWNEFFWTTFRSLAVEDQHGPQSLVEALLTPVFGFGMTASRLIVATLGVLSILLAVWWGSKAINKWFGLAVGCAVCFAPYHLTFSRNGDSEHVNIYVHAFFLLLAAQGIITSNKLRHYFLLGVAAGAGLYVYAASQLLTVFMVGLVGLVHLRHIFQGPSWRVAARALCFSMPALLLMYPAIVTSWSRGRILPIRTPYGTPSYEFTQAGQIPAKLLKTWNELFTRGTDPWFALSFGCLKTWPTLLAIIGLITLVMLCIRARRSARNSNAPTSPTDTTYRSMRFCCIATVGMVIVGILPGALSPEPHFRRLIILAIGIDILKGAGIYGIGVFVVRFLPRMVAVPAIMAALVPYALSEWNTFFYKALVTESSSKNSPVAIVREITSLLAQDKKAVLLVPNRPNLLNREEMLPILAFEFGYPPELPSSLTILPLTDVRAPITDAIIPIDSYVRLKRGELQLGSGPGSGLQLSNERMKENRGGQTHVIVDVVVGSPAMAGGNPST